MFLESNYVSVKFRNKDGRTSLILEASSRREYFSKTSLSSTNTYVLLTKHDSRVIKENAVDDGKVCYLEE